MAGVRFVREVGDVFEVNEKEGRSLIAAGYAEPLAGPAAPARSAKPERGVNPAVGRREKAVAE